MNGNIFKRVECDTISLWKRAPELPMPFEEPWRASWMRMGTCGISRAQGTETWVQSRID
jgi:hypothetical protein